MTQESEKPVTLDIRRYDRVRFTVDAVEVTDANMAEVAKWCKSEIKTETRPVPGSPDEVWDVDYIKVAVQRPYNEGQTKAYVGRFITVSDTGGYKIYTPAAFESQFTPVIAQADPSTSAFEGVMSIDEMRAASNLPSPETANPETELIPEIVIESTPSGVEAHHLLVGEVEEVKPDPEPIVEKVVDEDYICPQCGSDPAGEEAHAQNFHNVLE